MKRNLEKVKSVVKKKKDSKKELELNENKESEEKKRRKARLKRALLWISAGLAGAGASALALRSMLRHPAGVAFEDLIRTKINRAARKIGLIAPDKSIIPGAVVKSLSKEQMEWLRQAILAKGGGVAKGSGSFGGVRTALNKWTDDYRKFVHPKFSYSLMPIVDDETVGKVRNFLRMLRLKTKAVPSQIEHMLGDFSWSTDKDGNIIVNDIFDFNVGEGGGHKKENAYSRARQWAQENLSRSDEPDSQKTRFRINLGNPKDWTYNEELFHSYNDPYREDFPDEFIYNE